MPQRFLRFLLVLLLGGSFAGAGQWLHERAPVGEGNRHPAGSLGHCGLQSSSDEDHQPAHPHHDHGSCAVCQLLGSPRIDRLPGTTIVLAPDVPFIPAIPAPRQPVHSLAVNAPVDERGPPRLPAA